MKNFFKISKPFKSTVFDNYDDYKKIQYRSDPKEFLDSRLKITSSFTYIIPELIRLGINIPVKESEGITKGQLKGNEIKILDAGCRDGWTIEFLNSLGYTNVTGLELFDEYVNYCNERGRKAVKGDVHDLEFKEGIFDFVYCRHTLEHCLDPVKVIGEFLRVTKKGGAVYISFPLESETFGKHTTAIPNVEAVNAILSKIKLKFNPIYVDKTENLKEIIPEGEEMIIFLQKT